MAKSGFVPAWMKIPSADKSNGNQKLTLDRSDTNSTSSSSPPIVTGRQRHHSSEQFDHPTTTTTTRQSSPFFFYKTFGRQKADEQTFDEGLYPLPSRRSYSREHSSNASVKNQEIDDNGSRSINPSQRRLHSVSSYPHEQQPLSHHRPNDTNFDRLEQDFPSLNGREKHTSSSHDQSSSVWNNAAMKFRTSHREPFKLLDRTIGSNRVLTRKDRLFSTPNGFHPTSTTNNYRSITLDLQTNCKTQTKNLDKRSDFFNSLKNDSTNEGNKRSATKVNSTPTENYQITKGTLLLLSVSETPEEKDLLIQMGWKDGDEMTYEITDQDKEEYEKRIQHIPKTEQTSAALISALHRRALPCIDLHDLLRLEMHGSNSDDESSDE